MVWPCIWTPLDEVAWGGHTMNEEILNIYKVTKNSVMNFYYCAQFSMFSCYSGCIQWWCVQLLPFLGCLYTQWIPRETLPPLSTLGGQGFCGFAEPGVRTHIFSGAKWPLNPRMTHRWGTILNVFCLVWLQPFEIPDNKPMWFFVYHWRGVRTPVRQIHKNPCPPKVCRWRQCFSGSFIGVIEISQRGGRAAPTITGLCPEWKKKSRQFSILAR